MPYLAEKTKLGQLRLQEIYVHYDFPRLFSCSNEFGQRYLALSIGEKGDEFYWVYVAISTKRLEYILSGELELKKAFRETEDGAILHVTVSSSGDKVIPVLPSEIPDRVLPKDGQTLNLLQKNKKGIFLFPECEDFDEKVDNSCKASPNMDVQKEIIRKAFLEIRNGYSVDRVIADPTLGRNFLRRCGLLGLELPDYEINKILMGMRKANMLTGLDSQRFSIKKEVSESIDYASEIAWRYLNITKGVSLDKIICNPKLAKEFYLLASSMSPGYKQLEYNWVALQVRKARRSSISVNDKLEFEAPIKVNSIRKKDIPDTCGLYLFLYDEKPLFLSQADSLLDRMGRHLEISKTGLPDWVWPWKNKILDIAFASLPGCSKTVRQGMELNQVTSMRPLYNVCPNCAA